MVDERARIQKNLDISIKSETSNKNYKENFKSKTVETYFNCVQIVSIYWLNYFYRLKERWLKKICGIFCHRKILPFFLFTTKILENNNTNDR